MPRRLKLIPREIGELHLYLIYQKNGVYEVSWRPLQGHPISMLFTVVSLEMMDHAMKGYTSPLVKALGIPPTGALRKLPVLSRECYLRARCSLYIRSDCIPTAVKMPWCFKPDGIADEEVRELATEAVNLWREGVYIAVVSEDP